MDEPTLTEGLLKIIANSRNRSADPVTVASIKAGFMEVLGRWLPSDDDELCWQGRAWLSADIFRAAVTHWMTTVPEDKDGHPMGVYVPSPGEFLNLCDRLYTAQERERTRALPPPPVTPSPPPDRSVWDALIAEAQGRIARLDPEPTDTETPALEGGEDGDEIPPPAAPNVVEVRWKDGQISRVTLTPPPPRHRSFEERAKRAAQAEGGTALAPTWVGECSCGREVYEVEDGHRFTMDGKPHGCAWTTKHLQERRGFKRIA